jgi:phosphate-selective porin OprO/OprP
MRRVRPIFEGTVAEFVDFRIMPDFAGSSTTLFDAYANLLYFPQAQLQVGKFKPPVGLERLQSASATMFIERGFPTFLVPNRDIGGMLHGEFAEGLVAYQIGGFDDASDQQNLVSDSDDGKSLDARLFFHPFRLVDNELLDGFGIGVAGTWGDSDNGSMPSYRMQADSTNFFTYLAAGGGLPAVLSDGNNMRVSPQGYWYAGPFGLLWEYVAEKTEIHRGASHERPQNEAWQVEASWALTGENAAYKGLIPATSFSPNQWPLEWKLLGAIVAMTGIIYVSFRRAPLLVRVLGGTGMDVLTKVFGLITLAIGVQFILTGIATTFPGAAAPLS